MGVSEPVQVCACAASKIILASEHTVVHGYAAVTSPPPSTSTPTPRPSLFFHLAGAPAHPPTHTLASFHSSSLARYCCWHPSHTVLPTSSRAGDGGDADSGAVELDFRDSGIGPHILVVVPVPPWGAGRGERQPRGSGTVVK